MAGQAATIKDLIVAAAQGTAKGITEIQKLDIPVYLKEFELEVNYSCSTELEFKSDLSAQMKFWVVKAKFSASTSYKATATYGLKIRFLFVGVAEEGESSSSGSGT